MKMPPVKKIFMWLVVIFLVYAIFQSPHSAASIVGTIWDVIWTAITNVFKFFDALLQHG